MVTGCKPVSTPIDPNHKLANDSGTLLADASYYRQLVGKLIYVTFTRPDISYAVQILSQYMNKPTDIHLQAIHRSSTQLRAFSDSDWAGCPDTRRSVSGLCIFLGDSLITWKSKK
ncbi:PREDICTED: uncharacterized protein LOC109113907 [Nelumbo nucifera]|uniref:Uncharacterized protein LOC109113907 n=1 Tax=Nelumbo nucifera TaxID=4432 RepID=A0A1U8Q0W7_NELNU|nr:PREDICTED: uncharacterized protein LOC109113907 [Nelumbo nucifera]